MAQFDIRLKHQSDLDHHVRQGDLWFAASDGGANSAMVSYAALEYRYAIERLGLHYLAMLQSNSGQQVDLGGSWKFDSVRRRILELAGHQLEINRHFEFMGIVTKALNIEQPLHAPQLGKLHAYWADCSELCHIEWPLAAPLEDVSGQIVKSFGEISSELWKCVKSLGWPQLNDEGFAGLRNRYVSGEAVEAEVLEFLHSNGTYAVLELPDEVTKVIGTAIPPADIVFPGLVPAAKKPTSGSI